jgi:hypothetical protein
MDVPLVPANPWPEGHRQLSPEEFIECVKDGKHNLRLGQQRNPSLDLLLAEYAREGLVVGAIGPDGELALQASEHLLLHQTGLTALTERFDELGRHIATLYAEDTAEGIVAQAARVGMDKGLKAAIGFLEQWVT